VQQQKSGTRHLLDGRVLSEFVKGKRLIMAIDKCDVSDYDIVVCVNRWVDYGKPSILYTSKMQRLPGLDHVVCPFPIDAYDVKQRGFANKTIQKLAQSYLLELGSQKIYAKWAKRYNTRLYTGVAAVLDLKRFGYESLYISGMTLFKGCKDKDRQRRAWGKCHNPEANRQIMKELCEDSRVFTDTYLTKLLKAKKVKWNH